jgi:hypothetical protein
MAGGGRGGPERRKSGAGHHSGCRGATGEEEGWQGRARAGGEEGRRRSWRGGGHLAGGSCGEAVNPSGGATKERHRGRVARRAGGEKERTKF